MRSCKNCGTPIPSPNLGRGKWQRWCSDTCQAESQERKRAHTATRALTWPICTAEGCTTKVRSAQADYCEMHYGRIRRNGHLDRVAPEYRESRGICTIAGCDSADRGPHGLCDVHYARLQRNGHPLALRGMSRGAGSDSPSWRGADIKYNAAHTRVRAERGPARHHRCIDCGNQAAHWSYDHTDPEECRAEVGLSYSTKPEHYDPRCVPCHKTFDLGRERISA